MKKLLLLLALALPLTAQISSLTPSSGRIPPEGTNTFSFVLSNYSNINATIRYGTNSASAASSCHIIVAWDKFWLLNDAGVSQGSNYIGTSAMSNSQCTVNITTKTGNYGSPLTYSGTILFKTAFSGTKTIWVDSSNLGEGTILNALSTTAGSVNISNNTAPVNVSMTGIPANVNYGTWFTVNGTVRDADGYGNITYFHILINNGVDGNGACYFILYPNGNSFNLVNDDGSGWQGGVTMGTASWPTNRSCTVDAQNSSFTNSGTDSTANVRIMFKPFQLSRPPLYGYLLVHDADSDSGWGGPFQIGYLRTGPKLIVTRHQ